jgi:hypothetical protein
MRRHEPRDTAVVSEISSMVQDDLQGQPGELLSIFVSSTRGRAATTRLVFNRYFTLFLND